MEDQDKIIVLKSFEASLEANLAKTKLDAYGIPCFLTNENLSNLYPVQNIKVSGVRLHIFLNDAERAAEVLTETVPIAEENRTHCPRCQSTRVELEYTQKISSRIMTVLLGIFFALFPPKKVYHCLDCEQEF